MTKTIVVNIEKSSNRTFFVRKGEDLTIAVIAKSPRVKKAMLTVRLVGAHSKATIVGLIIGNNKNEFSLHTLQSHEAASTSSNLLVKSVLTDDAKFYYDGGIRVDPIAQKTDAYQRNENLLLSENAHAESKPALEILANDVRCTHGATVGPVSQDQLWYLASRGIGRSTATHLITWGFLISAFSQISDTIVRDRIEKKLWKTLSKLRV